MIEIIKRKKMEALILNVLFIIVIVSTIILNSDIYKQIFTESNLITDKKSLNSVIESDKRFVTLDLTDAKLMRLSIKNNDSDKIEINTYKVTYDDQTLIIFLKENTALTDKIKGEIINPYDEELEIKDELKKELKEENVLDLCFSNVNYQMEEKIITIKFLVSIILIVLLILLSFFNLYYYINPKKNRKYKKYAKSI